MMDQHLHCKFPLVVYVMASRGSCMDSSTDLFVWHILPLIFVNQTRA